MKSNGTTSTIYWFMTLGIVAESDLSGNLKSEYVFFDGERVARKDYPSDAVSYYFSGHVKTASVITDSAGNIKEDEDYYPWGGELQFINSDSNHYKFTGKERDAESGLDYFGARYYGNWTGRFLTPDWTAKATAVPYAEMSDPQSLNLYSYVRNRPTVMVDPDGHYDVPGGDAYNSAAGQAQWAMMTGGDPSAAINFYLFARQQAQQQNSQASHANGSPSLGIGIEVPAQSAVRNNVLNVAADPGHTFVYLRDASGRVVAILSFGPGQQIGMGNKGDFQNGDLPGNAHWPLSGTASTWEFAISSQEFNDAMQAIAGVQAHVPNYTPAVQCTSEALSIAARAGVNLPDGVGPVIARAYGYTAYSGNIANPYHLNQEMTATYGSAIRANTNLFPVP